MAAHRTNWQACKRCKRSRAEVAIISSRGHCLACSEALLTAAVIELNAHSGPVYDRWLIGIMRGILRLTGVDSSHSYTPVRD